MAKADLQAPAFTDDNAAREAMEAVLWPFGPRCPRCQSLERIGKVSGGRAGLYLCGACKRQFTVTVGTIFERSKVPLSKWWLAVHLLASSKKGMSAHQLHRMLGVTYPTAWFIEHRIRAAMADGSLAPMGGEGATVEIDETFIGRKPGTVKRRGYAHKNAVMTLIERRPEGALPFVPCLGDRRRRSAAHNQGSYRARLAYHDRRGWAVCAPEQAFCGA